MDTSQNLLVSVASAAPTDPLYRRLVNGKRASADALALMISAHFSTSRLSAILYPCPADFRSLHRTRYVAFLFLPYL